MKKVKIYVCLFSLIIYLISCSSAPGNKTDDKADSIAGNTEGLKISSSGKTGTGLRIEDEEKKDISSIAGYREVSALLKAYPGIVSGIKTEGDEIIFFVRGEKFYFADGRLLPEEKKEKAEYYRSYGFYNYPEKLPPISEPSEDELERINSFVSARRTVSRDNSFLAELYSGHSFDEILKEIRYINFLKFRFEVHKDLIPPFKAVERELLAESEKDRDLKVFIDSLAAAGSFNWRRANGSRSRSYHSYGIAVDFSPESFGNQQVFWDWSRKFYSKWYMIPYSRRWMVNEKFVSAFERQGFVWGGKWLFFDNMHFEYRPEILILSGHRD